VPPKKGPDEATEAFLRAAFQRYYKTAEIRGPERLRRREFGFMPFGGGMMERHRGFETLTDVKTHLVARVPAHVYYSTAYYDRPGAPTMDEKGWRGADLIFDLDADHLPGAAKMTYPEMLAKVKEKFVYLLDDFLLGDLGFEESALLIVFSGGRGYHAHVHDPRVLAMGSHERRELVDYITGKEIDPEVLSLDIAYDRATFRESVRVKRTPRLHAAGAPGWGGRVTRTLAAWIQDLGTRPKEEAVAELVRLAGLTPRDAGALYRRVFEDPNLSSEVALRKLREGLVDFFPAEMRVRPDTLQSMAVNAAVPLSKGETDEPVTSDIKRLIRLPTSLHGRTGLRVVSMSRRDLDAFDPLRDAVPDTFDDSAVAVTVEKPVSLPLRDESFNLKEGVTEIPQFAAVFLAARGLARVS